MKFAFMIFILFTNFQMLFGDSFFDIVKENKAGVNWTDTVSYFKPTTKVDLELLMPNSLFEQSQQERIELQRLVDFFTDIETVKQMGEIIIRMEVGPFISELNEMPYLSHGLLQPTTDGLRKYNHDTSFGFFGFIFGTLASTIELANAKFKDTGLSYREIHRPEIDDLHQHLVSKGFNVPITQVIAFYTHYMSKVTTMKEGVVSKRSVSANHVNIADAEGKQYGYKLSTHPKIKAMLGFYQVYNGALDKPKISRALESIYYVSNRSEKKRIWVD